MLTSIDLNSVLLDVEFQRRRNTAISFPVECKPPLHVEHVNDDRGPAIPTPRIQSLGRLAGSLWNVPISRGDKELSVDMQA